MKIDDMPDVGKMTREQMVEGLGNLNMQIKYLEKTKNFIKEALRNQVEQEEEFLEEGRLVLSAGRYSVAINQRVRTSLDTTKMKEQLDPDLLQPFWKETKFVEMRITEDEDNVG